MTPLETFARLLFATCFTGIVIVASLTALLLLSGCGTSPATREPPRAPDPDWCVRGGLRRGEVVELCTERLTTCRWARRMARSYGNAAGLKKVGECRKR